MENREEMIGYLCNHFRYSTLNSWNGLTSYANNVKVHNLDIPAELRDKAYSFVLDDVDLSELNEEYELLIGEFKEETGYDAEFNGKSDGYLVLLDTEWYYKGEMPVLRTLAKSIDDNEPEYFEDWEDDELRERVKLVQRFDKLCDDLRDEFIYYLENYDIVEEQYTVVKTRMVLEARG
jgi:hypothetical protein